MFIIKLFSFFILQVLGIKCQQNLHPELYILFIYFKLLLNLLDSFDAQKGHVYNIQVSPGSHSFK